MGGLLYYLYTGSYGYAEQASSLTCSVFHVHMHIAADRIGLADLQELTTTKFRYRAPHYWRLQSEDLGRALEALYDSELESVRPMRNCTLRTVFDSMEELYLEEGVAAFREIVASISEFNLELMARILERNATQWRSDRCEECGRKFALRECIVEPRYFGSYAKEGTCRSLSRWVGRQGRY